MVHPGRPSRGCQTCRRRRIKCDESTPTCSQCAKSSRKCPGYKDAFDLVLRDETLSTVARVFRANTKAPPRAIPPPREHQALCFFLANYTIVPNRAPERAYLDFLLPLYASPSPLLSLAVSAVSFAALSNTAGAARLVPEAGRYYAKALALTNEVLQDQREARSDHTLMAVVLMGLYESLAWTSQSPTAWGSHIAGACALLKLRGRAQLNTEIGLKLFILIRTQALISSMARSVPVDPILKDWGYEPLADNAVAHRLTRQLLKLPDLLRDARLVLPAAQANPAAVRELLGAVERLDAGLAGWPGMLPAVWGYSGGAEMGEDVDVWGGCDVYTDIWIASVWNNYRTARILTHALRTRCLLSLGLDCRGSVQVVTRMVDEICASLPFHMRAGPLGGYFLLWPLMVAGIAGSAGIAGEERKKWINGRLEVIGQMGIGQARAALMS